MSPRLAVPILGLDNTSELSAATLSHAGAHFAMRYVSRYSWKVVTSQEVKDYHSQGRDLGIVFEDGAQNSLGGYAAGQSDAHFALQQAESRGMPAGRPIYFAVDFDTAGRPAATDSYFDGVASVLTRDLCGPYGGIEVVRHQLDRGFKFAWQTYAWSRGQLDSRAQVYQFLNTNAFDYNHAFYADFGQWNYSSAPWRPDYTKFPATSVFYRYEGGKPVFIDEVKTLEQHYGAAEHPAKYADWLAELSHRLVFLRKRVWKAAHAGVVVPPASFGVPIGPDWTTANRGYRWKELLRATDPVSFRHQFPHDPHGAPLK